MNKIILNGNSPKEEYDALYVLQVGDVFKIESGYETVMQRIEYYTPSNLLFEVFPINPGTSLFTLYGSDHSVVVSKITS